MAGTIVLPPPTCTARREAGQRRLLAVVLLRGLYRPDRLQLFFKACAGRIVRQLCSPAAALFCRLCLPATFAMPYLLPSSSFAPVLFCFAPLVHCHVRQDRREGSYKDCPVGSYNTGLQWRPVRRSLSLRPCKKGGESWTACEQPATFPTPAFHEPETACEQSGSLLTTLLFAESIDPGPWFSVNL